MTSVFQRLLGIRFTTLPEPVRELHDLRGEVFFAGRADIAAPDRPIVKAMLWALGLPAPGANVDVHVRCALLPDGRELWRRDFAARRYESILEAGADGRLIERFGPVALCFDIAVDRDAMRWSLSEWRLFNMRVPRVLAPTIRSCESVDRDGRFTFRIEAAAPLLGRIIDYGGVLAARPDDAPVLLYDGVCTLCDGSVRYAVEHERTPTMRFVTLQSAEGRQLAREHGINPDNPESFLIVENGRALKKFDALFALLRRLRGPVRLLMLARLLPRFARNALYDWIAHNRYRLFGRKSACALPDESLRHRFVLPMHGADTS